MRPIGGTAGRDKTLFRRVREARDEKSPFRYDPFDIAAQNDVPCFEVGAASAAEPRAMISAAGVDVIVVAFFNQLLSPEFLALAPRGVINVHPSRLPQLRGPSPLFWAYRRGDQHTAVTVHAVDPGEDSGGILAQATVPIAFGEPLEALMERLSDIAGAEVQRVLVDIAARSLTPRAQRGPAGMRARRPNDDDCCLRREMRVAQVFHWVHGVGRAFDIRAEHGPSRRLLDAVAMNTGQKLPADFAESGDTVVLPFADGTVTFRAAPLLPEQSDASVAEVSG